MIQGNCLTLPHVPTSPSPLSVYRPHLLGHRDWRFTCLTNVDIDDATLGRELGRCHMAPSMRTRAGPPGDGEMYAHAPGTQANASCCRTVDGNTKLCIFRFAREQRKRKTDNRALILCQRGPSHCSVLLNYRRPACGDNLAHRPPGAPEPTTDKPTTSILAVQRKSLDNTGYHVRNFSS